MQWLMLQKSTYTTYSDGVNTMIVAREEFPQRAVEVDPMIVPADSGYVNP